MRPFHGVLIIEGEADQDGRVIAPGALDWRTPVAVYDPSRRRILGHAYAVERHGDEIRVVGSIDLPLGSYGIAASVVIDAQAPYGITAARIRDAELTGTPSFERARISVVRDNTDDKVERTVREAVRDAYLPDPDRERNDD